MANRTPGVKTAPPLEQKHLQSTPITVSSSQPVGAGPRTQKELMDTLSHELSGAVFEATELIESVYPCPVELHPLIDTFVRRELAAPRSFKPAERDNYKPLANLLNTILTIIPREKRRGTYYENLAFSVYDRPVEDLVDGRGKLQPDVLASLIASLIQEWLNVEIAVEVKDNWSELLCQAATYGRAMLEQSLRWFSVVIGFNHKLKQLRFMWYTRKGSFQTGRLRYHYKEDLTVFARGLVGLAMASASGAGKELFKSRPSTLLFRLPLIPKRVLSIPSPPQSCIWRVDRVLCQRICILGHGTHVYRVLFADPLVGHIDQTAEEFARALKLSPPPPPPPAAVITSKRPGPYRTHQQTKVVAAKAAAETAYPQTAVAVDKAPQLQRLGYAIDAGSNVLLRPLSDKFQSVVSQSSVYQHFSFNGVKTPFVVEDGIAVIAKESWPITRQSQTELEMFQSVQGQHGIPDVLGGCTVPHDLDVFTSTLPLKHSIDWPALLSPNEPLLPEDRIHQLLFMKTEGFTLTTGQSDQVIVHGVIDSIIGTFFIHLCINLYQQTYWTQVI